MEVFIKGRDKICLDEEKEYKALLYCNSYSATR